MRRIEVIHPKIHIEFDQIAAFRPYHDSRVTSSECEGGVETNMGGELPRLRGDPHFARAPNGSWLVTMLPRSRFPRFGAAGERVPLVSVVL